MPHVTKLKKAAQIGAGCTKIILESMLSYTDKIYKLKAQSNSTNHTNQVFASRGVGCNPQTEDNNTGVIDTGRNTSIQPLPPL